MPSERQDELVAIFAALRSELRKYETWYTPRMDLDSRYDLWSERDVVVVGRERKGVWFAGLIVQSSYVGFSSMPVHAQSEMTKLFALELLGTLEGTSCFHIAKLDAPLLRQVRQALKAGHALYRERGWA